jgi:pimeloyl-ACP methyl ester carboxylesterase
MHFRGTMDHWDPLLVNTLAGSRPVILFDNAGVGKSNGNVSPTIKGMAEHVIDFLALIDVKEVDLLGFSMGGYIAQMVALDAPGGQIRRLIITGSGPSAGDGIIDPSVEQQKEVGQLAGQPQPDYDNALYRLFFAPSETSQAAGQAYWMRVNERDESTSGEKRSSFVSTDYADGGAGIQAMVAAGQAFMDPTQSAEGAFDRLGEIKIPVFIAQGHDDFMIPTSNSFVLQQRLPNARLKIFPDSGHGFLYQYAEELGGDVNRFLDMA